MRLIKPSFEIWDQQEGLEGVYKQIERSGRVCYKSEDKITETSAKEFVERMIKSGHGAMLEHGTVYLKYDIIEHGSMNLPNKYYFNEYSVVTINNEPLHGYEIPEYKEKFNGHTYAYITTNYRVLVENGWLDDLKYICEPTEYHEKRTTVRFICDRGVSHELVRHRVFSFAQESTRYCNYSKDKFGKELTFIKPSWWKEEDNEVATLYIQPWRNIENCYLTLIENGIKPQDARAILPNALKTEVVMTGFESDWDHFFELRCVKAAHPDMQKLANELKEQFHEKQI